MSAGMNRLETANLRVSSEGTERSHVFISGEDTSICSAHRLYSMFSKTLPPFDADDRPAHLCEVCERRLEQYGRL